MPLLTVTCSEPVDRAAAQAVLERLSRTVSEALGKPERYLAASFRSATAMLFGGSGAPCCVAELSNIGELTSSQTERMSRLLCTVLADQLAVPADRIYVVFRIVEPKHWGRADGTFA